MKWTTNSKEYKILKWTISVINLDSQVNQRFEKNPVKTSESEVQIKTADISESEV